MKIITSYNVRLKTEYISAMKQTVMLYTDAVCFYMDVILEEWNTFAGLSTNEAVLCAERLSHATTAHPAPKYDFDGRFPKFPCYLRRAAISSAFGKCCAYISSLANWEKLDPAVRKKAPGRPRITMEMPAFYKGMTGSMWTSACVSVMWIIYYDTVDPGRNPHRCCGIATRYGNCAFLMKRTGCSI